MILYVQFLLLFLLAPIWLHAESSSEVGTSIKSQIPPQQFRVEKPFSLTTEWNTRTNIDTVNFLSLRLGYSLNATHEFGAQAHMQPNEGRYAGWSGFWRFNNLAFRYPFSLFLESNYTSLFYHAQDRFSFGGFLGTQYLITRDIRLTAFIGFDGIDRILPFFSLLYFSTLYTFDTGVSLSYLF